MPGSSAATRRAIAKVCSLIAKHGEGNFEAVIEQVKFLLAWPVESGKSRFLWLLCHTLAGLQMRQMRIRSQ